MTNLSTRSSRYPSPEGKNHYETPALSELQRLIWARGGSDNHVDQVWPNLYLGDAWAARSKSILQSIGITHILNAADGPYNVNTGARYYRDLLIQYYGVQAFDDNSFDISVFFHEAADFIHKALNTAGVSFRMSWYSLNADDLRRPRLQRTSSRSMSSHQSYQTPEMGELQRMLWTPVPCRGNVNEVWPNLYIGDLYIARNIEQLRRMGITHIVNAAAGRFHIDTGAKFYRDLPVDYYGVEADDDPKFDLSIYFYPTAKYIRAALNSPRGKVLVHCAMGISRSATLVLAFLMIYENKNLVEALKTVREHRGVCPNTGFLSQLRELDLRLTSGKGRATGIP